MSDETEKVRGAIKRLNREEDKHTFTPDDICPGLDEKVKTSCMEELDDKGVLRRETEVRCPEGHLVRSVLGRWDPIEVDFQCEECSQRYPIVELERNPQYKLREC